MNKVIIVTSQNGNPEDEVNERIASLGEGWRVISASTAVTPYGEMSPGLCNKHNVVQGSPLHVYYVTTVVLWKQ